MQNPLSHYVRIAKRWVWMVILGIVICGGVTFLISKRMPPVYQASAVIVVNLYSSPSPLENVSASQLAAPTYAQLLTSPPVLEPVLARHPGLTLKQLGAMVTAKSQPNSSLIDLDVENGNPQLAARLANEISQSFASYTNTQPSYTNTQLRGIILIVPAEKPIDPIRPNSLTNAGIGALVGLGLALSLIVIFEWIDDRLAGPGEVQELLRMEILTVLPKLSRKQRMKVGEETPLMAERYRMLCASLNAEQAARPFKLMMITSALSDEGKSSVAAHLASFLAMAGKRVLLVDANLRNPILDQHFHLENRCGLSDSFLEMGGEGLKGELDGQETDIPMLRVLPAGVLPPNPAELLLTSVTDRLFDYFRKAPFDYIIFDTSPLLPVADTRILLSHVQATVLVIDASKTSRTVLLQAGHVLSRAKALKLGVVINKSPWSDYSDGDQYLHNLRQMSTDKAGIRQPDSPSEDGADATLPDTMDSPVIMLSSTDAPSEDGADATLPDTLQVDNTVAPDITVRITRPPLPSPTNGKAQADNQ